MRASCSNSKERSQEMEIGRHKDSGSHIEAILNELLLPCFIKVVNTLIEFDAELIVLSVLIPT